jgi:hypothetical protein
MNDSPGSINTKALGNAFAGFLEVPVQLAAGFANALATRASPGCEIPPPCWEPRNAGTCCLTLIPGSVGTVRVRITNCQWSRQIFTISALGKMAGWINLAPTTVIVDPQETATILVSVSVPANMKPGESMSGPLIVRGCLNHFARIDVNVTDCVGLNSCNINIKDCPDHVHHWYDHFYCYRPCQNASIRDVPATSLTGSLRDG